jgi:hypothetical protein
MSRWDEGELMMFALYNLTSLKNVDCIIRRGRGSVDFKNKQLYFIVFGEIGRAIYVF